MRLTLFSSTCSNISWVQTFPLASSRRRRLTPSSTVIIPSLRSNTNVVRCWGRQFNFRKWQRQVSQTNFLQVFCSWRQFVFNQTQKTTKTAREYSHVFTHTIHPEFFFSDKTNTKNKMSRPIRIFLCIVAGYERSMELCDWSVIKQLPEAPALLKELSLILELLRHLTAE